MKKFILSLLIFFFFILFIFIKINSYTNQISSSLKENIFRLHIISNSNLLEDQLFKLKCRDTISSYINENLPKTSSKDEIICFLNENTLNRYSICYSIADKENIDTTFNIYIDKSFFPTKQYGKVKMPSGTYDALKIEIGQSSGNNWWCSLFPPLCFTEVSSEIKNSSQTEDIITSFLPPEESNILLNSQDKLDINFKFKLLELYST